MFGYKARIEEMDGNKYWMIYKLFFGVPLWMERCNSESSCKRRLQELRRLHQDGWLDL